jgi:hypothetical protein
MWYGYYNPYTWAAWPYRVWTPGYPPPVPYYWWNGPVYWP